MSERRRACHPLSKLTKLRMSAPAGLSSFFFVVLGLSWLGLAGLDPLPLLGDAGMVVVLRECGCC